MTHLMTWHLAVRADGLFRLWFWGAPDGLFRLWFWGAPDGLFRFWFWGAPGCPGVLGGTAVPGQQLAAVCGECNCACVQATMGWQM